MNLGSCCPRTANADCCRLEAARAFIGGLSAQRVILDSELARIYGVETRILNQAVKRNAERFPNDFRFQLTTAETAASRSQFVTLKSGRGQNIKFLPYAFTEHGAIMAATILNSPRAVEMSIYVVRAFVQLRELISSNKDLARRLDQLEARIEKKLVTHDDAIAAMARRPPPALTIPQPRRPCGNPIPNDSSRQHA